MTQALKKQPVSTAFNELEIIDVDRLSHPFLEKLLSPFNEGDPYLSSPAYLRMTGRRGMKLLRMRESFSFVCRHPNDPDKELMFYPQGQRKAALIESYAAYTQGAGRCFPEIGRVPKEQAAFFLQQLKNLRLNDLNFSAQRETLLDWNYPVHTLSTRAVALAQGHAFKDFRKNLSRASRLRVCPRKMDFSQDPNLISEMALSWAGAHAQTYSSSPLELAEPYFWMAAAMRRRDLSLDGYMVEMDGTPAAFVMWEKPRTRHQKTVSSLASLSTVKNKGMNEYLYWLMCRDLSAQGIERVCIGGSETAGLDAFKLKMNPVLSQEMMTIKVS